jgi:hypothetical protein
MTIDPFVLLTPVLLLGVMALLRFVGCNQIFGLDDVTGFPSQPVVMSISPKSGTQGDQDFTLIVTGTSFINTSVVRWNDQDRQTAFVSGQELWAHITAADITAAGMAAVTVFTPFGHPSETSNSETFLIVSSAVTVTFDNPPPAGTGVDSPLDGVYKNLDFGTGRWFWKGSGVGDSIFLGPISSTNPTSGPFLFANAPPSGRVLLRMRIISDTLLSGNISLQDGVNPPTPPFPVPAGAPPMFIETGWTLPSATVTVISDIGWDIAIDTIIYQGPP